MKLSFSISSKSSSSSRPPAPSKAPQSFDAGGDRYPKHGSGGGGTADGDAANPKFITVFDPSESLASDAPAKRVIAPIPNADLWSHKKMKNLPLPTADDPPPESRFVLESSGHGSADANHYGLMIRSNGAEAKSEPPEEDPTKRRFQEDTKDLPDEELPDVPVEGFGAAILAGYGWSEGKGIGRSSKEDANVFEYKRRAGTEGFGYVQQVAPLNTKSSSLKRSQKEEIASGFASVNVKGADNVGRDERKAESRVSESEREEKRSKYRRQESTREVKCGTDEDSKSVEETNGRRIDYGEKSPVRWLKSHIRVRVISKKFRGGKLYLKKGEVVDVVGPTTCDIMMDESNELVQVVDQDILETALPKRGGSVLVLYGKNKGVFGSLVERDSEKETGLVRDADSHALINVRLEQIAEYVGDPSYLGY